MLGINEFGYVFNMCPNSNHILTIQAQFNYKDFI